MGEGAGIPIVLCPQILQRISLCVHTGVRTLIISTPKFPLRRFIRPEIVVHISGCWDLIDFIGADLVADFRRTGNIGVAVALLRFRKLADMVDGTANAAVGIVNVGAGQDHLFTVKAGNDDAFPILDGKECVVFAVDEADHALILVGVWKGDNAHDVYRLTVTHRASPLSFFGVVRFCSCCAM